jgi:hypothetical protein
MTSVINQEGTFIVAIDSNPVLSVKKKIKTRGMSYSERFKETGRVLSSDMSLAPRKPAKRRADGTFSMPQGRRPGTC